MPYITRKPWMVIRDEMLEHMELFLWSWFQGGLMPYHVSFMLLQFPGSHIVSYIYNMYIVCVDKFGTL